MKAIKEMKFSLERETRQSQTNVESKRIELEEKKLTAEKELLTMRLKSEAEVEFRKQRSIIVQGALTKGLGLEEIKDLLELVDNGVIVL